MAAKNCGKLLTAASNPSEDLNDRPKSYPMKEPRKFAFITSAISAIFLALVFTGCSNNSSSNDREIEVDLIEAKTELPSKIRLFFKVNINSNDEELYNLEPSHFEIYENGNKASSLEGKSSIQREPGDFMYSSILMLDLSGSIMNNSDLPNLKEAATSFIEQTMPAEGEYLYGTREMAIYWFDGRQNVHSLEFFTSERDSLLEAIKSIGKDEINSDGSTNLNGAVIQGLSLLDSRVNEIRHESEIATAGSMVLFTDGTDQAGWVGKKEALDSVNTASKEYSLFSIGLGGEIDETVLSSYGKDGFELAEDSLKLNDTFLAVAERLESESNSYYVLEYCSPKRNGEHVLELRVIYEDMFGSLDTRFSAEGFTGGCSVE